MAEYIYIDKGQEWKAVKAFQEGQRVQREWERGDWVDIDGLDDIFPAIECGEPFRILKQPEKIEYVSDNFIYSDVLSNQRKISELWTKQCEIIDRLNGENNE